MKREAKRARRIRDKQRMKARARRFYPHAEKAVYWADYLRVCSCALCGNRRRREGEGPVSERRQDCELDLSGVTP